ncbi:MAG: tetratricopeptide repeat protein [Gemmatimonadota bacterium]
MTAGRTPRLELTARRDRPHVIVRRDRPHVIARRERPLLTARRDRLLVIARRERSLLLRRRDRPLLGLLLLAASLVGCGDSRDGGDEHTGGGAASVAAARTSVPEAAPVVSQAAAVAEPPAAESIEPKREIPRRVTYEEAESAFRDRRYDEAVQLFTAYTERKPANPWGHYMLGLSAWKAGLNDHAIAAFEKALEGDPGHLKSLVNLSRVLLEEGRPEEAVPHIAEALELDPGSAEAWRVAGNVRSDLGQVDGATEAYRRAILLDEMDAWAMNNLGLLLIRQRRFEEALGPLARASELRGEIGVFWNNLGVALERTGHLAGAADAYRAALRADGSHERASVSLARVEARGFDSEESVDLSALARAFAEEVEGWSVTALAADPEDPGLVPGVEPAHAEGDVEIVEGDVELVEGEPDGE